MSATAALLTEREVERWLAEPLHDRPGVQMHDFIERRVPSDSDVSMEWRCHRCVVALRAQLANEPDRPAVPFDGNEPYSVAYLVKVAEWFAAEHGWLAP